MKIGYCVEGSTDLAFLEGLRQRWCPNATLVEGKFRGVFRRREIPKACLELRHKGADLVIMLRDANNENWRDVQRADAAACGPGHQHVAVFGVCDRNIECWLTADADYTAGRTGVDAAKFRTQDPKAAFEAAMSITALDRKEAEVADYTRQAPLRAWLGNKSFEDFYGQLRQRSEELHCELENLLERKQE